MTFYNPRAWFWIVGGDGSRVWSSAQGAYVTNYPADQVTRIASEAELRDVLRAYGIQGPGVDATDIKAEAQRRIILASGASDFQNCVTKQLNASMRAIELTRIGLTRALTEAEVAEADALQSLADTIKSIRARSNVLESMDPPPADYRADRWWP